MCCDIISCCCENRSNFCMSYRLCWCSILITSTGFDLKKNQGLFVFPWTYYVSRWVWFVLNCNNIYFTLPALKISFKYFISFFLKIFYCFIFTFFTNRITYYHYLIIACHLELDDKK